MKKLLLSIALLSGLSYAASAQTEGAVRKLSIGAEVGLPTEKNSDALIAGGSLQFEQPIAKSLNLTVSGGYLSVMATGETKDYLKSIGAKTSSGIVPLKGGLKYYFGGNFYGAAEAGAAISTEDGGGTAFAFGPTLGAAFSISDKSALDFGVRYENWSRNGNSTGLIGLRAAFSFGL